MSDGRGEYSTVKEEELRLINEDGNTESDLPKDRSNPEGSSWLKVNFKLALAVSTIVGLVLLGIIVGAVSNHSNKLGRLARSEFTYDQIRLPKDIEPLKYRIYLHPNLTTFKVFGSTRILIRCKQPTDKVIFHFKDNAINDIKLLRGSYLEKKLETQDVLIENEYRINKDKEVVMIKAKENLVAGSNYTLVVRYSGKLKDALQGFYKSSYKTKSGEKR